MSGMSKPLKSISLAFPVSLQDWGEKGRFFSSSCLPRWALRWSPGISISLVLGSFADLTAFINKPFRGLRVPGSPKEELGDFKNVGCAPYIRAAGGRFLANGPPVL